MFEAEEKKECMNIWLTFIVPIYKTEKYLDRCVQSILGQPFDDIEVILVDDGSPDMCPQKCDEYAKNDIRVRVLHKKNEGVSKARESGIALAQGRYIACIDSDDWIAVDYCNKLKAIIEKSHPSLIKYGYCMMEDEKAIKSKLEIAPGFYSNTQIVKNIYPIVIEANDGRYIHNALWTCIIEKTLIKKYCITSRVVMGEDAASLKPCIINATSMVVIEDTLYYYRKNSSSIIQSKKALPWDGPLLVKSHYEKVLGVLDDELIQQIHRNTIHNLFNVAVSQFYQKKPYSLVVNDIVKNITNEPYHSIIGNYQVKNDKWKNRLAYMALRHRWFFLMWLYARVF